jgi:hypothetical protein
MLLIQRKPIIPKAASTRWWHKSPPVPIKRSSKYVFIFFGLKMCPKSQKMKPQKRYLEVSNSIRDGVRAFFRFTAEQKNKEFFQMSQKMRLKILRCVVVMKVFSKKRYFLA